MGTSERKKREKDERRSRILDAAEKVFLVKGFQSTTVDEVAGEAELAKGTLYLYFRTKEEMLLAVALRWRTRLIDRFDQQIPQATNGFDLLHRLVDVYCEMLTSSRDLHRQAVGCMAQGGLLSSDSPTAVLWRESGEWIFRILVNALERGKLDGSIRPGVDSRLFVFHLFGGSFGVMLLQFTSEVANRIEASGMGDVLLPSFFSFVLDAVRNPDFEPEATKVAAGALAAVDLGPEKRQDG